MLPTRDHKRRGPLMSILRVLSYNAHLAAGMPRYEDNRRFKVRRMLKSSDMLKALFDAVREYLVGHQVRTPPLSQPSPVTSRLPSLTSEHLAFAIRPKYAGRRNIRLTATRQ